MNGPPNFVALPGLATRRSLALPGEHLLHFYEDEDVLLDSLRHFALRALNGGMAAVVIATAAHLRELEEALEQGGTDLDAARRQSRYITLEAEETLAGLLADGWPRPDLFNAALEPLIAAAAARHGQVCVFGEMVALLWKQGRHAAAVKLEELWDDLRRRHFFSLYCAYPVTSVGQGPLELMRQVCGEQGRTPSGLEIALPGAPWDEDRELKQTVRHLEAEIRERKAMEWKLAQREHELEDFLENAAVPMHSVGPDGRILWANKAELELLGYPEVEYVGRHVADFHVESETIADMLERLRAGATVRNQPAQLRCRDGSVKQVLIHSSGFWEGDRLLHTRCVTIDVTSQALLREAERKRDDAAREARRSGALLAAIVESSDDAIVSKTLDGVVTSWNAGAANLFGYSAEEMIGRPITAIIPPELHAEEARILEKLRRGERIDHFETERVTRDGRRVEIFLSVSPVRDADGNIIGASKVARDITEQRRARRELQRLKDEMSEELAGLRRLHEISTRLIRQEDLATLQQEVLAAALSIADETAGCLQLWDADAGGLKTCALQGLSTRFCEALDAADTAGLADARQRQFVDDVLHDAELTRHMPPQLLAEAGMRSMLSTPLIGQDGRRAGMLTVFGRTAGTPPDRQLRQLDLLARLTTDALERTRTEAALKEADRRKNEFLAVLAHELRNPLAPIRYAVSIVQHPNLTPEQRRGAESVIERQVDHMARLLDDLLDVSRITRGTLELRKGEVDLAAIISAAVEAARPLIDAKRHALSVGLPASPVLLDADAVRLAQIFSNLLNNAAKYTDTGGSIELRAEAGDGQVTVRIRDNGIGMAPHMIPRLFSMFVQAGEALEHAEGGLGIGLALVRGLVALHGGTVEASSAGQGMGSEFVVRLPVMAAPAADLPEPDSAAPLAGTALRVVIADDNRDIADTCGLLVQLLGHEANVVYSGEEAFGLAETLRPDVLLLDIGMPDVSGYALARRIRARPWGATTTLIAVTGWGQEEDKQRALAAGFDWHLTKPIDQASLEQLFRNAGQHAR